MRTLTILFLLIGACFTLQAQRAMNYEISSTELLKFQDVDTLSVDQLAYAANQIYARKGYTFTTDRYKWIFEGQPWYKPLGDNSKVKLSEIEEQNVSLLIKRRKEREEEKVIILDYFKNLKELAIKGDSASLDKIFDNAELFEGESSIGYLISVLKKIDFDDLNWYKNNALHSVMVDNGYVKMVYSFQITSEGIALKYNYMAHSEIMERFGTIYSEYMSEEEYAVWWVFRYNKKQVVFERIGMAG